MVPECFTWIPHLLHSLISCISIRWPNERGFGGRVFPDDILIEILSRLPAEAILRCRRVCKHWRILTSSSHFEALQYGRAPTIILVQSYLNNQLYVFDKGARRLKKIKRLKTMRRYNKARLISSCGCALLFRSSETCIVFLDLFTGKEITTSPGDFMDIVIFYDPSVGDYRCLKRNWYQCFFYDLQGTKQITCESYARFHPVPDTTPVIVNLALHWIVAPPLGIDESWTKHAGINICMHAIMVFRMKFQDLITLPHPAIDNCDSKYEHEMMSLFVGEHHDQQCLSLCHVHAYHGIIDIWILEDYADWAWVLRHRIGVDWDGKDIPLKYYFSISDFQSIRYNRIKVLSVQKDELLIDWFSHGLYHVHLTQMTYREIHLPYKVEMSSKNYDCITYTSTIIH